MTRGPAARVVLVGYQDQDNLGLRYLSARLRQEGHATRIVTADDDMAAVVQAMQEFEAHVVGFSLIFQYLVPQFGDLVAGLRAAGSRSHVTMGGHYASFEPAAVLDAIPGLDSVVRFEGEDTLLELTERVAAGLPWTDVAGIAYRGSGGVECSAPRRGRDDLDEYPWPDRDDIRYEDQPLPTASILGGRGCPWNCSFCSIVTFYEANGTKGRRRRRPSRIVDEIEHLHRDRGVRILLWQDDDFLSGGRVGVSWAHAIATECIRRGLHEQVRWKISCRSDEVRDDTIGPLVEAGLTHVYMGVESGDEEGLRHLNKHLRPEVHLRARDVLLRHGLSFDFGFMLLEPWSTFASVRTNLAFLREMAGDGASPIGFCRTLPYAGTPIEEQLRREGRLHLRDVDADYDFLDPRLDAFYDWLLHAFAGRNFSADGTGNILRLMNFESRLDLPDRPADPFLRGLVEALTALSNRVVLDTVEAAVDYVETLDEVHPGDPTLAALAVEHATADARLRSDLAGLVARRPDVEALVHLTR